MPVIEKRNVLSGISVKAAMRRQVIQLPQSISIDNCINRMIKFKINAVLVSDTQQRPAGVVSKTDIMSAFYAGFPTETALENIMVGPLLFCYADDELEKSLDTMQRNGIHRLYVLESESEAIGGVLAYPDIVGLLYRYCRACDRGLLKARRKKQEDGFQRLKVKDVMTPTVNTHRSDETLAQIIEGLTAHQFGAVLIKDAHDQPVGVVSKSDLIVAYKHGMVVDAPAGSVMSTPVHSCDAQSYLAAAIQQMLIKDVQRIFVHAQDPRKIVGVLSLSDAARFRSGSCRACTSSRMVVGV